MTPTSTRTELEESILTCCKSLFLTSAIPELIKQDGTPKQIEYLAVALQKEITCRDENKRALLTRRALLFSSLAVTRIRELVWLREPVSLFIKLLKAMNTVV